VWWCRAPDPKTGKRGRVTTGRTVYEEALVEAARLDRVSVDPAHRPKNQATLQSGLGRFLEAKRAQGRAEATLGMYKKKARHLARLLGGEKVILDALEASDIDKFINTRRDEGATANTIHKELTCLRGILRVAKRDKTFHRDIAEILPVAFSPEYTPRRRSISIADVPRLLRQLTTNHAACVAFLIAAACRLGDGFRAEVSDLTAVPGFIRVRATKTKKNRDQQFRLVPVTEMTRWLVEEIKRATHGRKRLLFDPWTNITRDLAMACERTGVCDDCLTTREKRPQNGCEACARLIAVPRVSANDLRRTHGMWLRASGVEPNLIGEVLGHVDGRMVERVYGKITPEDLSALLVQRVSKGGGAAAAKNAARRLVRAS